MTILSDGRTEIIVREAAIVGHHGQSEFKAYARLWGRRILLDRPADIVILGVTYKVYRIVTDE